jgi:Tol biopolymer transport system component
MIMSIGYELFFFLSIVIVIFAVAAIGVWKWKAVTVIFLLVASGASIYWLPLLLNQWKFSDLHEKEKWRIVCSHDTRPDPLFELRFLKTDKALSGPENHAFRNPALSPDGVRIAFSIWEGPERKNPAIGVSDVDGKERQWSPLVDSQAEGLSWSPDGEKIAFWSNRNPDTQSMDLSIVEPRQGTTRVLLRKATFYGTPFTLSWSPDSRRLLFASIDGYVSVIDTATLAVARVIKGDAPSWSPDGRTIIYREGVPHSRDPGERLQYYAVKPDGSNRRLVFDGGSETWDAGSVTQPVVWSPDSRYILFFKTYDPMFGVNFSKIYILDTANNKRYLIKRKKHIQACSWGKTR